jgi:hypothetical protein
MSVYKYILTIMKWKKKYVLSHDNKMVPRKIRDITTKPKVVLQFTDVNQDSMCFLTHNLNFILTCDSSKWLQKQPETLEHKQTSYC